MSGFAEERRAIEARFLDNFTGVAADRIKLENVRFDQPNSGSWVALTVLSGGNVARSIGSATVLRRWVGIVQIDIYTAEGTGTDVGRDLADSAGAIFQDVTVSAGTNHEIIFRTPEVSPRGVEAGWHRFMVSIPYQRDKVG